ncbi:MAG: TldD/PmbA family protein [Candidatus Kariarchaeaceae archaeon]
MVDIHELAEYSLKKATSHGEVIIGIENVLRHQIRIANSELELFKQWNDINLDIFIAIGRKTGSTSIINPTFEIIDQQIPKLISFIEGLEPSDLFAGIQNEPKTPSHVDDLYDSKMKDFPEKAPELLNTAINAAEEAGAKRTAGSMFFDEVETCVQTSHGFDGNYKSTSYELTLRSFVEAESSGQGISVGRTLDTIEADMTKAGREAGEIAKMAVGGKQGKAGTYDLVLHPTVAASLMGDLLGGANPVMMMMGMSSFNDRIGEKLGVDSFTVTDDGTKANGLGSAPFDIEGTNTQQTPLFDKGALVGIVHNATSAKMFGTQSTGNSQLLEFWTGAKLLVPGATNYVFEPGDNSFEELLESSKPTIYVTSNWYLRYTNQIEGLFSTIPRDGMFIIEDGEISKPIQKLRITDNLLRMINNIEAIGKEIRQVKWWEVYTPTFISPMRIKDVPMTAATQ